MISDNKWREKLRVTYITLTALLIAVYAIKVCLLIPLLKEDYDGYAAVETSYMVLCGVPSLLSAAGAVFLDIRLFRRLTLRSYIACCAAEIATALELIPVLLFWCGAISSLSALVSAVMILFDHATYDDRTARAKRIEAARLAAEIALKQTNDKNKPRKKNRKKGGAE